jgi:hypothetical protein
MSKMKKNGSVKNIVVEHIMNTNVDKMALIPLAHVTQPSFESDGSWTKNNQDLVNVAYKMKYLVIEYTSCTCEWLLQGNICKHRLVLFSWPLMLPEKMLLIIVEHGTNLRSHKLDGHVCGP